VDTKCRVKELDPKVLAAWSIETIGNICMPIDLDSGPATGLVSYPDRAEGTYDPTDPLMRLKFGPRWAAFEGHSLLAAANTIMHPKHQVPIFAAMQNEMPVITGTAEDRTTALWPALREQFRKLDVTVAAQLKAEKTCHFKWQSKEESIRKLMAEVTTAREHKDADDAEAAQRLAEEAAAAALDQGPSKSICH
jgi:hypothetical protein